MTPAAGALAVLAGLLLFSGHPPLDVGAAGLLALVPLLGALRTAGRGRHPFRDGALLGTLAGAVFFGLLLSWISRFGIMAWVLLVGVQTLFVAVFGAVVAGYGERRGRGAVAVATWTGLEVLRAQFPLTGMPWGLLGLTQHAGGPLLPIARVGGVVLLSAVLAAVAVALEALVSAAVGEVADGRRARSGTGARTSSRWGAVIGALVVLLVVGASLSFLPAAPPPTGRTIDMAAVQGNDIELPPTVDRLNRVRIERVVERMAVATERLTGTEPPDLTVWPENALDNDYREVPQLQRLVDRARAAIDGRPLLAGTLLDGPRPDTAYNTLALIGEEGDIRETYVKRVLVPFGEYVPFRRWLEWVPPLEQVPIDYLPGEGPHVFTVDHARVGPVTCFESVFADLVHDQVRAGAEVLVVSTNNASFGRTAASRQHLAFSQLRAVETGRYVLHAGISGLSAVVTPDGGLGQRTELFEQAIVREDLPLIEASTPATGLIPWVDRVALLGLAGAAVVTAAVRRTGTRSNRATEPEADGATLAAASRH